MSIRWQGTPQKPTQLKPFEGALYPLAAEDLAFFRAKYEIDTLYAHYHIQRGFDNRVWTDRYVMSIWSPVGKRRGRVSREGWEGSPLEAVSRGRVKALTSPEVQEPLQSWYLKRASADSLIVVEDQLSAIKLYSHGFSAVALLGVPGDGNIGADRVRELASWSRGEVIIALDADATDKAFEFARRWGMAFRKLRVAILERDLKDEPAANFGEVLGL